MTYSIIRDEEYKKLGDIEINGTILDLGGNLNSEYHSLIKGENNVTTVNLDNVYGSDLVFSIEEKFPIENSKFDAVLCMNVLEHIYNFDNVVSETFRVLKKGGYFVFAVPFMHHIHGSPDDYFRYTRSAILKMLIENKFEVVQIEEIGLGLFSLFYQSSSGVLPELLKGFFKNIAVFTDSLFFEFFKRYRDVSKRIPLGYFVVAEKN